MGVTAFSVAGMLGLVGVMGLARPAGSATPTAPADTTASPHSVPAPRPGTTDGGHGDRAARGPDGATRVQVTTPTTTAPVARTHGSH